VNGIAAELVRRCEQRRLPQSVALVCAAIGQAADAGAIELADLLDKVNGCQNVDELGDLLVSLAADVRELESAGGATWTH
jgi:hypothetical protein